MINKPMLILPLPDGIKSSNGLSPLTVLVIVGFFIYLDLRHGFTSSHHLEPVPVIEQPRLKIVEPPYEPDTEFVQQPSTETSSSYISEDEDGNEKRIVKPVEKYDFEVTTDNAHIRSTPERKKKNALGMLDLHEKLIYVESSNFTESFRRSNGETVDGYWFYVFRPKTNSYGWIHEINLSPCKK